MSHVSRTADGPFDAPPTTNVDVPIRESTEHRVAILKNFVNAIDGSEALIAPGTEGIGSVELANTMLYSTLTDSTVELPLDAAAFEAELNHLIAASRHEK